MFFSKKDLIIVVDDDGGGVQGIHSLEADFISFLYHFHYQFSSYLGSWLSCIQSALKIMLQHRKTPLGQNKD